MSWLSLIIFAPWAGALLVALWRGASPRAARATSLGFSLTTIAFAMLMLMRGHFQPDSATMQFEEIHAWIPALSVRYHLGVDGMSFLLVLLTGLVAPMAFGASFRDDRNPRAFGALFLLLQGSALGVFLALDFFLWFVFWELSLVPAFFLIKLWGGPQRTRAAYQFVIYTLGGSACMLLGFAALYGVTNTLNFRDLAELAAMPGGLAGRLGPTLGNLVFLGVLLGLAVKVPLFPFHSWLPLAYAEAPTGVSMFLTGVMSKMGVYGFFRILAPLFPQELHAAAPMLLWLALGGVVFGAYAALRQSDLKRMVAYSSLNHLSYCLLALFAFAHPLSATATSAAAVSALNGALLQMFNHGLSAAALFFYVGVLESRTGGRRGLQDFGGVRTAAPILAGFCGIALFSSLGLPGLNGFVGEFLIFRGVFGLTPWAAAAACLGLLVTAIFLLTFYQRVFHGPPGAVVARGFADLSRDEFATMIIPTLLMFLLGIAPQVIVGLVNPLVTSWTGGAG
jgi:NADH-quinone oxidoreductase subunit M